MNGESEHAEIGIIGGSGFYRMKGIEDSHYIELDTPFGKPTERILLGKIWGKPFAFISRHGIGHRYNPSEVNYRANLFALKMLGVSKLLSVAAVGSLKEEMKPMDLVIWDQYFDNTFKRAKTFFEDGVVAHVSMAEPTCECLSRLAYEKAKAMGLGVHKGGTLFIMEGPQFSSKGESFTYRKLGFDVIGMTQVPECKLARELEMCYLPLSFVTDYDCWHEEEEPVTVDMVIEYLNKNVENAGKLVQDIIGDIDKEDPTCNCSSALQYSIITNPDSISNATYKKLEPIIGKYIKPK
ncbi:MAG: S-methyl-5'-thioadenosine phosphorylase [Candidatus Aminicenantes bacterium]|nr:S-methyl-5'-thioadenosine phosphorylase [Candidatus Aminicenantes bacterium]NIM77930.1 S-methyl-5'-thioadenosine phosphorylase [Candidatus Aminicenantes bacterium]NIN22747.1 S-methyl-5'-thioadenosine phosphorylase [Candidatus Aminicenantes bacterium]NIN45913.1 S-methyl-5'-thioadenosine phosphorylase [Candidatus Aminicenantes bacterium]NIN89389.1 S-methyl-5'-thioadenosine phosphorylase [Candidatus Aminicenantes bacterium]